MIMNKRRLFISQPFTGYDVTELNKQRKALHKVFAAFIGDKPENVELIDQLNLCDNHDTKENFRSSNERDLYRFCRSIMFLGMSTDVVLYGDWEKSRGCKLEVEILKQFGIPIIDQNLLIAFCIKNNMIAELEELWPDSSETLKGIMALKSVPTTMVSVVTLTSDAVSDDEIIIGHYSTLALNIPAGVKVYALRFPTNGEILELTPKVTWDSEKFPLINKKGCEDLIYVSPNTASKLLMGMDRCGDVINLIIPQKAPNEITDEQIQKVLDDAYPLCVIKDRYGGTYSDGEYTAWLCGISYIPEGVFEDDVTCGCTWGKLKTARKKGEFVYGVGETPDEALRDLAKTIIRNSKRMNKNES